MRKLCLLSTYIISFLIMSSTAMAHDYWIMPETFHPAKTTIVEVAFTCGHSYFSSEETPDITKYQINLFTPDGQKFPLTYSRIEPEAAWSIVPILGPGTYVVGASSIAPSYWSKTPEGWVPKCKSRVKNVIQGGKYVKSVKTFLQVNMGSESYKRVLGYTIEAVPQKDPTTLKGGQILPVLVLFHGKPVKGAAVFAVYEGYKPAEKGAYPVEQKTDRNGIAHVKISGPGKWLIGAKYQFDTPGNPDADYENYRAYMMFEIQK